MDDALDALNAVETALRVVWFAYRGQWHVPVVAESMHADLRDKRESLMETEKGCRGEGFGKECEAQLVTMVRFTQRLSSSGQYRPLIPVNSVRRFPI